MRQTATAEVRLDEGKAMSSSAARWATRRFGFEQRQLRSNFVAARLDETENRAQQSGNLGNVGSNRLTVTITRRRSAFSIEHWRTIRSLLRRRDGWRMR